MAKPHRPKRTKSPSAHEVPWPKIRQRLFKKANALALRPHRTATVRNAIAEILDPAVRRYATKFARLWRLQLSDAEDLEGMCREYVLRCATLYKAKYRVPFTAYWMQHLRHEILQWLYQLKKKSRMEVPLSALLSSAVPDQEGDPEEMLDAMASPTPSHTTTQTLDFMRVMQKLHLSPLESTILREALKGRAGKRQTRIAHDAHVSDTTVSLTKTRLWAKIRAALPQGI